MGGDFVRGNGEGGDFISGKWGRGILAQKILTLKNFNPSGVKGRIFQLQLKKKANPPAQIHPPTNTQGNP